jgi:hypothetical protein
LHCHDGGGSYTAMPFKRRGAEQTLRVLAAREGGEGEEKGPRGWVRVGGKGGGRNSMDETSSSCSPETTKSPGTAFALPPPTQASVLLTEGGQRPSTATVVSALLYSYVLTCHQDRVSKFDFAGHILYISSARGYLYRTKPRTRLDITLRLVVIN